MYSLELYSTKPTKELHTVDDTSRHHVANEG